MPLLCFCGYTNQQTINPAMGSTLQRFIIIIIMKMYIVQKYTEKMKNEK